MNLGENLKNVNLIPENSAVYLVETITFTQKGLTDGRTDGQKCQIID